MHIVCNLPDQAERLPDLRWLVVDHYRVGLARCASFDNAAGGLRKITLTLDPQD